MDKFDIHKWQRDANTTVNEAHSAYGHPGYSQRADDLYKAFAKPDGEYANLEYEEREYIVDQLKNGL